MLIVLASNYLNHHMLPLCFELDKLSNHHFRFVATSGVPGFRKELGYKEMNALYDFVIEVNKDKKTKQEAIKLCNNCDVLIYGSAPYEYYIGRLLRHKLTFRYSERVLKKPFSVINTPKIFFNTFEAVAIISNDLIIMLFVFFPEIFMSASTTISLK